MQNEQDTQESYLEFPCQFPIKAMGLATEGLHLHVFDIVKRHAPDTEHNAITHRASKNGKYLSVTVTIEATSREQLDAIYQDLTASEQVMMAL
ncbi:MAG: transcriptional regulator [Gammaproteobacteria bacterium SG8_11]|nr:MAG: transcriptional regulator [Gammaproteobacteria bacterium SG8_11]